MSTTSSFRFVQAARTAAANKAFCLVSIDFDHFGYFLKVHGAVTADGATEASRRWIEFYLRESGIQDYIMLQSSLDELLILCVEIDPDLLTTALRCAQMMIAEEGARRMPGGPYALGFTAAIAPARCNAWVGVDQRLRELCALCEQEIHRQKESGGRGGIHIVLAGEGLPLVEPVLPGLKAKIWRGIDTHPGAHTRTSGSLDAFLNRAGAFPRPPGLLLVSLLPLFGGALFESIAQSLDGGLISLPTGRPLGKLGFLNRLFQEHMTPNIVVESAFAAILDSCPPTLIAQPSDGWARRLSANLYCWLETPQALGENELEELLCTWLDEARGLFRSRFLPDLDLPVFQVAALPIEATTVSDALTLGESLYYSVRPEIYQLDDCVALYDCRTGPETLLSTTVQQAREWAINRAARRQTES